MAAADRIMIHTHTHCEYLPGRHIIGQLPHGEDLITALMSLAEKAAVSTALFSIVGSVSMATYGVFDQAQQVYITDQRETSFDMVSCSGSLCRQLNETAVHVHAVIIDNDGRATGGRIFSPTRIFAAEVALTELKRPQLLREYDPTTGLMLYSFSQDPQDHGDA